MAVEERSPLGFLYFAEVSVKQDTPQRHVVGLVEQNWPWRKGKAICFKNGTRGRVVGLWFPTWHRVPKEFQHDRWLLAGWANAKPGEISTWRRFGEDALGQTQEAVRRTELRALADAQRAHEQRRIDGCLRIVRQLTQPLCHPLPSNKRPGLRSRNQVGGRDLVHDGRRALRTPLSRNG